MKIDEESIQKSIQNRGSEKYRKMIPKYQKKGSKMEPKGFPKVDKIEVKIDAWKSSKFSEKIVPRATTLRRTNRAGNNIRATQPASQPTN